MTSNSKKRTHSVNSRTTSSILVLSVLCAISLSACTKDSSETESTSQLVIAKDKSNSETLALFYLSGISSPPQDALAAGLLSNEDDELMIDVARLFDVDSVLTNKLQSVARKDIIEWDDFEAIFADLYYEHRAIPNSLESLKADHNWDASKRMTLSVDGVMTSARRNTYMPIASLESAIASYSVNNNRLIYPVGTLVVGDHVVDGSIIETTVMLKRADEFWDFAVYDEEGSLIRKTLPLPKSLQAPQQCTGCHFGSRAFEPEKSFPADAPVGPSGERRVFPQAEVSAELVQHLDEHRLRSDYLLGLYATVHVAREYAIGDETRYESINFQPE